MTTDLHFSIGPVQTFVLQSRRTRDLWGSSYVLSYLSGHALIGARKAGGRRFRPDVENDALVKWIENPASGNPPLLGSIPNQFTLEIPDTVQARDVASAAENALLDAWNTVCDEVYNTFIAPISRFGVETEEIWKRQVHGFWEFQWVAANTDALEGLLSRRKRWRTHWVGEEPGDKCMVIPELQELSGHVRATASKLQDRFWDEFRANKTLGALDLRDHERLCAVALVKRLYPRIAQRTLGGKLDVKQWPSTLAVAAGPWSQRVIDTAPALAETYAQAVCEAVGRAGTLETAKTGGVSRLVKVPRTPVETFLELDPHWFHSLSIKTSKHLPEDARPVLRRQLEEITNATDPRGRLGAPPVYYALLLADGDELGKTVQALTSERVSAALARFMQKVPGIIQNHQGVTVYAGGDDVLALLPVSSALACASQLATAYQHAYQDEALPAPGKFPTLSAAVVFSHMRDPLNVTLEEAHRLLDEVAKEANGRNSLAVTVARSGGASLQWVSTWKRPGDGPSGMDSVALIHGLSEEFRSNTELSSKLVHGLRTLLGRLSGDDEWRPGRFSTLLGGVDAESLIRARGDPGQRESPGFRNGPG